MLQQYYSRIASAKLYVLEMGGGDVDGETRKENPIYRESHLQRIPVMSQWVTCEQPS